VSDELPVAKFLDVEEHPVDLYPTAMPAAPEADSRDQHLAIVMEDLLDLRGEFVPHGAEGPRQLLHLVVAPIHALVRRLIRQLKGKVPLDLRIYQRKQLGVVPAAKGLEPFPREIGVRAVYSRG
jgi:hypothetical protein